MLCKILNFIFQWLDWVVPVRFSGRKDDETSEGLNSTSRQYIPWTAQRCWHHYAQPHWQGNVSNSWFKELTIVEYSYQLFNLNLWKKLCVDYLSFFQLSGLQKYEELLTRINAEVAQRLLNIMPTVWWIFTFAFIMSDLYIIIKSERLKSSFISFRRIFTKYVQVHWCWRSN